MFRYLMGPLMEEADDKGGGGGVTMAAVLSEVDKRIASHVSGAFDKFKKDGLGSVIDDKLGPVLSAMTALSENVTRLTSGNGNTGDSKGRDNDKNSIPPEVNVQLKNLMETTKAQGSQIETLKREKIDADQRAEKADRHSIIRGALNSVQFVSDGAAQTAFSIVEPHIRRTDEGGLIGGINGDNFPVDNFVKDYLTREHSYLLRPTGVSGSGASAHSGGVMRSGMKVDLADIKTGMKPETRAATVEAIAAALQSV